MLNLGRDDADWRDARWHGPSCPSMMRSHSAASCSRSRLCRAQASEPERTALGSGFRQSLVELAGELASSAFGWKTGLRRANQTGLATLEYAFTGVASLRCSAKVSEAARERPLDSAERASGFGAGAGAG